MTSTEVIAMGQYFAAVNSTKREYVCPWCSGNVAKLWEWIAGPHSGVLCCLLRRSTGPGGGDIESPEAAPLAGSWAGDQVALVDDYDGSGEFEKAFADYENISPRLAEEYNRFAQLDEMLLEVRLCGSCSEARAGAETVAEAEGEAR